MSFQQVLKTKDFIYIHLRYDHAQLSSSKIFSKITIFLKEALIG